MNWLRYVLLAVCILSALAGYRKGLVRTVLSMVSLILVTGLAIWMNPYVTDVLNERTELPQYVEKKCLETFENNEFLSGENQDVQKKWLESMGVPEELVNQILRSGAVQEYQDEQLHSLASYAAKAVSEKIMKGIAFFLTLVLAVGFVTIAVKIVELIAKYEIETQEELAEYLNQAGFAVTQATVSRDIRELKLTKVQSESGKQRYMVLQNQSSFSDKYIRILRDGYMSMDMAQNILVIKTVSGMAMAVAAALDAIQFHEIVGCIAGDDTIMCAIRSVDDTIIVMEKIKKMVED